MRIKYAFSLFENAISKKEIAKIKKSSSKFSEAKTLKEDGLTKEDVDLSFRDSSVSFSNDAWIYTLLFPFIEAMILENNSDLHHYLAIMNN